MTLRLAPQASEPSCFAEPLQVLLEQLRSWKAGAYSCDGRDGRWVADCLICGEHRSVRIDEHRPGGRITVRCRTGCTAEEIGVALDRAVAHDGPWARLAAWEQVVGELQELSHAQAALIDRLLARLVPARELPGTVAA